MHIVSQTGKSNYKIRCISCKFFFLIFGCVRFFFQQMMATFWYFLYKKISTSCPNTKKIDGMEHKIFFEYQNDKLIFKCYIQHFTCSSNKKCCFLLHLLKHFLTPNRKSGMKHKQSICFLYKLLLIDSYFLKFI